MMDRKSFINSTGRWSMLALLAAMVWFLFRNRDIKAGAVCSENEFCSSCSKFGSCDLPQAKEQM